MVETIIRDGVVFQRIKRRPYPRRTKSGRMIKVSGTVFTRKKRGAGKRIIPDKTVQLRVLRDEFGQFKGLRKIKKQT